MNILAIETSQAQASVCLCCNGNIVASHHWEAERNHDSHLFPALQHLLQQLGDAPLDIILVGAGPGSYGGVRVALAAAVGIATVKCAKTVAICSWLGLVNADTAIISDARRGGWTLMQPNGSIDVLTTDELKQRLNNGLQAASIESKETLAQNGIVLGTCGLIPSANGITRAWLNMDEEQQKNLLQTPPEPIYVRPPHITAAKRKPWEC